MDSLAEVLNTSILNSVFDAVYYFITFYVELTTDNMKSKVDPEANSRWDIGIRFKDSIRLKGSA